MIEKKIHYVWMGKGEKSDLILRCIKSWEQHLKGYEIVEWNEENFDIDSNKYVKEAYENKKWAFVSDYVRLHALFTQGGVYLDTDMEILKPIDCFLEHGAFSGFESNRYIPTGIMGAEKNHPWIKALLNYYDNKSFYNNNGSLDLIPNVSSITQITVDKYGLKLNNFYQELPQRLFIYPKDYFCPSDYGDTEKQIHKKLTENSYCIHHYNGSWLTPFGRLKIKLKHLIGESNVKKIRNLKTRN